MKLRCCLKISTTSGRLPLVYVLSNQHTDRAKYCIRQSIYQWSSTIVLLMFSLFTEGEMFVLQIELGLTGRILAFFEILLQSSQSSLDIVFENVFSWLLSLCKGSDFLLLIFLPFSIFFKYCDFGISFFFNFCSLKNISWIWLNSIGFSGDIASSTSNKSEVVNTSLRFLCHWIDMAGNFKQGMFLEIPRRL